MATSGTVYSAYGKDSRLYVKWKQTSQSVDGNYTNISWEAGIVVDGGDLWYTNAVEITSVYINGTKVSSGGTYSNLTTEGTFKKLSGTAKISHNSDGTKKFTAKINGWFWSVGDVTGSKEFTLDTIPRATVPTVSASSVNMGSSVTVNMPRKSDSFTHTLSYTFGSKSGTIGSDLGTSKAWSVPLSLASEIPSATSKTATITCTTYKGSTKVGSKTVNVTLKVPDNDNTKPSLSFTHSEYNTNISSLFGVYVMGNSRIQVKTTTSGKYGASVGTPTVTINGTNYTGSTVTSGVINKSGNITIKAKVTDSRGYSRESSVTVSVKSYSKPYVSNFSAIRCDQGGNETDDGEYAKVTFNAGVTNLTGNTAKYEVGFCETDGTCSYETLPDTSLTLSTSKIIGILDTDKTYDIKVRVTDVLGNITNPSTSVGTSFVTVDYNTSGKGIAFGKVSEADEFTCNMYADFLKDVKIGGRLIVDNKVLWGTGGLSESQFMLDTQTITLDENVSEQTNGIVLVWSRYTSGQAENSYFNFSFIPKWFVSKHNSAGVAVMLTGTPRDTNRIGIKYVYISNTSIKGYAYNDDQISGTDSGINLHGNSYVLRYVIGV